MFVKRWWVREENDGGGNDLGGSTESTATEPAATEPAGDSGGEATQSAADPNEPKSMLEAIEKGLAEKQGEGEKAPAKPEEGKPKTDEQAPDTNNMPEGLSPKAQQRFKELVSGYKRMETQYQELEGKYQQAHEYAQSFSSVVRDIGASPEQLQGAAEYIRAYNSGDLNTRKNLLLNELRDVSMRLGEPVESFMPQADPLSMYPDLKQAVESYQISREQALELVRHRHNEDRQNQMREAEQATSNQRQQSVNQWVTEKESALTQIDQFTKSLAQSDPMFPAIQAQLMADQGGLKDIVENFPPSTWVSQVKLLISTAKNAMIASGYRGGGGPRPLSGSGGKPQGSSPAPKTMYEAMFGNR